MPQRWNLFARYEMMRALAPRREGPVRQHHRYVRPLPSSHQNDASTQACRLELSAAIWHPSRKSRIK